MSTNKRNKPALVMALAVILTLGLLIISLGGLRASSAKEQQSTHQDQSKLPQLPVVNYETSGNENQMSENIRQLRSSRYDNRGWVREDPNVSIVASGGHWGKGLPALPIVESDVVLVGQVTDAQAHLSQDKTGIYSEFAVRVEALYKGKESDALSPGKAITIAREGGAVRFPSGHIQRFIIADQGMPLIGQRYVLFLKQDEEGQSFNIITGYELHKGRVRPLDNLHTFALYAGVDESHFLNELRNAINRAL